MNKVVLMIIIAVVFFGGVGGAVVLSNRAKTISTNPQTQESTTSSAEIGASTKSIKELLTLGVAQECTYSQNGNGGTTFISGGKMRGDFTSTVEGQTTSSHMIMDGKTSYVWTDGQKQGFSMAVDETVGSSGAEGNTQMDINQKMNFSCKPWVVSNSMFNVPTDIQFTDLGKLKMPTASAAVSASAEESSSEDECSACNSIPEPAKAQCLQALGCK